MARKQRSSDNFDFLREPDGTYQPPSMECTILSKPHSFTAYCSAFTTMTPMENTPDRLRQLHLVTGAAGVGKSTFARKLANQHAATLLDSDTVTEPVVRAGLELAGLDPADRDSPAYKAAFRNAVYQCLLDTAMENIGHVSVVVVGPFTKEITQPDWPDQLFDRFGQRPTIWYLHCDDQIRYQRVVQRGNPRDRLKLIDWKQHSAGAPPTEPVFQVNRIDTNP